MLQIAIYSDRYDDAEKLKSTIQDFLIETRAMAKVSHLDNPEAFLVVPDSYDIYIMDMDSKDNIITLTNKMKTIDTGAHYIFISSNPEADAVLAAKARCDYFLEKPLDEKEFLEVLKEIKKEIKEDNVIIKIAGGERRIRANHLNYINIEKRCLCYHLSDGTMFDGQTLRSSFQKAITPLDQHPAFLFLAPSLLINLGAIKILNRDNIVFEDDSVLFFPAKQYDNVRSHWLGFTRIL